MKDHAMQFKPKNIYIHTHTHIQQQLNEYSRNAEKKFAKKKQFAIDFSFG